MNILIRYEYLYFKHQRKKAYIFDASQEHKGLHYYINHVNLLIEKGEFNEIDKYILKYQDLEKFIINNKLTGILFVNHELWYIIYLAYSKTINALKTIRCCCLLTCFVLRE